MQYREYNLDAGFKINRCNMQSRFIIFYCKMHKLSSAEVMSKILTFICDALRITSHAQITMFIL